MTTLHESGEGRGPARAAVLGAALGALIVVLASGIVPLGTSTTIPSSRNASACLQGISIDNSTSVLGSAFRSGGIWGLGANATSVLLGGTALYVRSTDVNRPAMTEVTGNRSAAVGTNLTPIFARYFPDGGIYSETWNGSTWLVSGQAEWNGSPGPALVSWNGRTVANLTPLVAPFFLGPLAPGRSSPPDWGIWETDWNGTAWLLAGNGSRGAVLLAMSGSTVTDLTPRLAPGAARGYITLLAGNSSAWLVGGYQVFESYEGGRFTDLLPASPFSGSGMFAADWNGTAWLVGGGSPPALAVLRGGKLSSGPALPSSFDGAWVNSIAAVPASSWAPSCSGWLIAGLGLVGPEQYAPALALWLPGFSSTLSDLTARVPGSFLGGEVEDVEWAPSLGPNTIVLSGQGSLNLTTGASAGALANLVLTGPP